MRLSNQLQGLQVPKPQEKESYLSALESDVVVLEAVVVAEAVVVLEAAVVAEAVVVLEAVLQGVTMGYSGLQGVTGGYKGLQGVTGGYKGLQGITKNYRNFLLTRTFPDTFSCSILYKNQSLRNLKFLTKTMD